MLSVCIKAGMFIVAYVLFINVIINIKASLWKLLTDSVSWSH